MKHTIQYLKNFSKWRSQRARDILRLGNPSQIDEFTYLVPASNPDYKYKVTHIDSWTCECPDFKERCKDNGLYCKHIKAIQFFMKLKNKTEVDDLVTDNIKEECIYCNSKEIIKRGVRTSKKGNQQRYFCKSCNKRFILNPIKYIQLDAKKICLVMDLYFKGLSLRDIKDTLNQATKVLEDT